MRTFRFTVLSMLLLAVSYSLTAQSKATNPWNFIPKSSLAEKSQQREITPKKYLTLDLSVPKLKSLLAEAPLWQTQKAETQSITISLPMPDGSFQQFKVVEAPVMHPDLQAKYPTLRSYAGQGIDDPQAYFRGDFTLKGFHGMIMSPEHSTVFIDPYAAGDVEHYQVYYKKDFSKDDPWKCDFDEIEQINKPQPVDPSKVLIGDCQFRDYTLALACTGEYATYHGGTVALVMSAFVTSMTRVNGVYETDASVHMTLHPNTDQLIFLNPSTDPYTNNNGSTMLGQNQTTCDNVIGNANYDIGHVFSTGGGGVAYLGAVCSSTIKAGGVTGSGAPIGDAFDIDYVAHEMGHQFGANHTQNNNCNRNNATAMEPGSASTIMGYAGICSPDVQPHSDDYFHAISLQEIAAELTNSGSGGGNTCSTNSTINNAPTANAGADYVIPKSTPYILTGTSSDANEADVLTYTWEQMDNAVATMPPVATSTTGPAFRSFKGTTSPSRYLPRLQDVVNNTTPTWEVLSSVGRTLNWRMVVRDNHIGGGCAAQDNMVVTVNGTAGPFLVTAPNTNVSWPAGSTQTVTWNVAGTTAAPVSCANVDIFLSVDGGFTYPYTLATATPNDGTQSITIPVISANTTSRIMVKANGNIFYDISNVNFTITAATNSFTLAATPSTQSVCAPTSAVYAVAVGVSGTYSGNVTLSVTGLPSGATGSFSTNPVSAPGSSNLTVTTAGVTPGSYNLTINGSDGSQNQSTNVTLVVLAGAPGATTLVSPANGATGVSLTPTLTWNATANATTYDVQVSTVSNFASTVVNATGVTGTSYNVTTPLTSNTTYYWRVRAINSCGTGAWASPFSFTTANTSCITQASTDVPKSISASGTPTVTSTLTISANGTISDVNLLNLGVTHTWINDLIVKLKSPLGTEITLFSQICNSQDNVLTNFDDSGSPYSSLPCPPTNNGTYQPLNALSAFNGQNVNGVWTLTVQDVADQDGGSLNSWSLNICYTPNNPPVSVSVTGTNVSCNGGNNGTATATATGGTGSYTYAWSNGGNTQTISGLTAGTYICTVTSGSSSATGSVTITQPAALVANVTGTNPSNGNNNGTATANPSGGTSPYSYAWSNGGSTQTITGLGAGTYTCTVTDNKGCTAIGSVTLVATGCYTQGINFADFNTNFGIWTDGGSNCVRTLSPAGSNSVRLRDNTASSVTTTGNLDLAAYNQITVEFDYVTNLFASGEDFWLQISMDGGATFTIKEDWVAGVDFNNDENKIGAVTITGPFTATTQLRFRADASDASDLVFIDNVDISSYISTVVANVTGTDPMNGNNGSATANPSGGTSPYSYAWSNGGNTQTITGLAAGTYTCTVTDNQGCTAIGSVALYLNGCNSQTINLTDFNSNWGIWTDGGTDCVRILGPSGTISARLRDNTETSVTTTGYLNLTSYNEITISFSYNSTSFESGEDFWLQIATDSSATFTTIEDWIASVDFNNGENKTGTVTISGPFTMGTRLRFRADASADDDLIYIDDVNIAGCVNFAGYSESEQRVIAENTMQTLSSQLLAYPNPTSGMLTVEFTQEDDEAVLAISDLAGKLIQTQKVATNGTGLQQVQLDVSNLRPGSYLLQVMDGKERKHLQFVKF